MSILLPIGLVVVIGSLMAFFLKRRRLDLWQSTVGTVKDLKQNRRSDESGTLAPIVAFRTKTGEEINFQSSVSSSLPPTIGESVPVLYDPTHPSDAVIDRFIYLYLAEVIGLVFGIATLVVALVLGDGPSQ
jgi:hypothetical protein